MSPRVTRSSARLSAGSSSQPNNANSSNTSQAQVQSPAHQPPPSRKRKAPIKEPSPNPESPVTRAQTRQRFKRTKVEPVDPLSLSLDSPTTTRSRSRATLKTMSAPGNSSGPSDEASGGGSGHGPSAGPSARRKPSRKKAPHEPPGRSSLPSRPKKPLNAERNARASLEKNEDEEMADDAQGHNSNSDYSSGPELRDRYDDGDDESFGRPPWRGASHASLSHSIRALTGMLSGVASELRGILEKLRQKDDPTVQLVALNELSHLLLVSNEETLAGNFTPEPYVKELIALMQPNELGEENPDIMLVACRCIANMMEALPSCAANVVYAGAVPILCQKLLEIHYIDVAEQALSTLEKISVDFPAAIVREGGLTACLTYLDFFATSTQRTAVTTAANCCRNIPEESFPVVRDVMPILLRVLNSSDQKVLEQGCMCVSRIVESFKYRESKLEELVNQDLMKAILRLLLPGTTNLIGVNIHTQFLRVLAYTARASPRRAAELLKLKVMDTLYQILTGISPPSGDDVAAKIDKVMIMQALIHRPRDQIFETLNVIYELLPGTMNDTAEYIGNIPGFDSVPLGPEFSNMSVVKKSTNDERIKVLAGSKDELRRFVITLLPTLTDAYASTVNLGVRQKVLAAQLKMLSTVDVSILQEALRNVSYSSFLAAILSQQDHPSLVGLALRAAELLLNRLESVYTYQFFREGVIAEITKLSERPLKSGVDGKLTERIARDEMPRATESDSSNADTGEGMEVDFEHEEDMSDNDNDNEDDENDENDDHQDHHDESDISDSDSDRELPQSLPPPHTFNVDDLITKHARHFLDLHKDLTELRDKADTRLARLKQLTSEIRACFQGKKSQKDGFELFQKLATYFGPESLENITSYELLSSEIVDSLLEVFNSEGFDSTKSRASFLRAFMGRGTQTKKRTASSSSPATPFSVFVHKLQDLLSRAEHFEVITVHNNSFDTGRASVTSMLAKQLRIKLVAEDESAVPRAYRQIMVSIHGIATFKALDDYLRPRISLAERPRGSLRDKMPGSAIAAYAATLARGGNPGSPFSPPLLTPSDLANAHVPKRRGVALPLTGMSPTPVAPLTDSHAQAESSAAGAPQTSNPVRRSRRHQQRKAAVAPPENAKDEQEDPIECADETHISDDEEMDHTGPVNAIVDELENEMGGDEDDPSAVNMKVASTGRVTAHNEDGTRVATPVSPQIPATRLVSAPRPPSLLRNPGTASSTHSLSYAAAMQAVPQDWHVEFSVNDQPISNGTTIYRAVHFNQSRPNEISARNIWSAVHTIKFKRVPGPPPPEPTSITQMNEPSQPLESGLPESLSENLTSAAILKLLSILHGLNSNIDDVMSENKGDENLIAEPLSQFVNTKLTAKLNRQLEEPLIVASSCLPSWSEDLARFYPFLFPFETRHLFLQSTSFGYSRSMSRWQSAQVNNDSRNDRHRDERPFLGKLQRQKVRISRSKILESAMKVLELYGSSPSILEVEYFEEVGTGLGPTLEFYASVSKEFAKKKIRLWRENDSQDRSQFAFGEKGLFPAPMGGDEAETENGKKILNLFRCLGKFVARSMLDSRIIDISFNPTFFRIGDTAGAVTPSLGAVRSVDKDLANSLQLLKRFAMEKAVIENDARLSALEKKRTIDKIRINNAKVEDMALDFTLPGYPSIEMLPGGSTVQVGNANVDNYVNLVIDFTLGTGVIKQVEAFREGFSQVFPYAALQAFTPDELVMLFGRVDEDWSLETLMDSVKADHGFNLDSKSVLNLLRVMSNFTMQERRDFLQFVTGSPKLPIGGFKALTPMFTVVCKPAEAPHISDDYLPSVMTCVNYLKLPDYSSVEVMRRKLAIAMKEGQGAFHLS